MRRPTAIRVLKTTGDCRIYPGVKAVARGEFISVNSVYRILGSGYNNRGDKFEYVKG